MLTRDRADQPDANESIGLQSPERVDGPVRNGDIGDGVLPSASDPVLANASPERSTTGLDARDRRLMKQSTAWGAIAGFIPFLCVLWDFGLNPLRAATAQRFASNFYDIQGRAFLHGHVSVPLYSFGIEGFVIDGHTYMYFPPFPALLRLPVMLVTDRLDGRMTAPSMLLGWIVLAVATAVLIWTARVLIRGTAAVQRTEAAMYAILLASVTGGSVVVFHAALPWVYHEVYIWATAFTVATLAGMLTVARRPTMRAALVTGACALGAILTRTTSGWAMALTLMAIGAWMLIRRDGKHRRVAVTLAVCGFVALAVGAGFNWAKFRHPYMFPLEHQEWTKKNMRRRLALRMNDGTITGPQFFLTSLVNYFRPDGIRFVPYFPFVTLPAQPARSYGGAFLDQWYRTGSIPVFMPLLFGTTIWGFVTAFRRHVSTGTRALRLPLLGALLITGGVMFYGYVAHRYTSEFLPVLILGAVIGVVDIARRLGSRSNTAKRTVVIAMAVVAGFGGFANAAVSVTTARLTYGGAPLEQYVEWQTRFGGGADDLVVQSDELPADGPTDQLRIVGDCDALYLATGDDYEPWVTVQVREYHVKVKPMAGGYHLGLLPLIVIEGDHERAIALEADGTGQIRLRMGESYVYYPTDWITFEEGETIDVGVRVDTSVDRFYITFDGVEVGYLPSAETDGNSPIMVGQPTFGVPGLLDQTIVGFTLTPEYGPRLDLCDRLLAQVSGGG